MRRYGIVIVLLALCVIWGGDGAEARAGRVPARGGTAHVARPFYRPGKAPKAEARVENKTVKIDVASKAVQRIRSLPSKDFAPAVRKARVEAYFRKTFGPRYVERVRVPVYVGPYRPEFVAATYDWLIGHRALWAWHNRAYVDDALWATWMADAAFAGQINVFVREKRAATPGFIPTQYAELPPTVVYNDAYIDAAYNPEIDTTPSIVVGALADAQLDDLMVGAARLYAATPTVIDAVAGEPTGCSSSHCRPARTSHTKSR